MAPTPQVTSHAVLRPQGDGPCPLRAKSLISPRSISDKQMAKLQGPARHEGPRKSKMAPFMQKTKEEGAGNKGVGTDHSTPDHGWPQTKGGKVGTPSKGGSVGKDLAKVSVNEINRGGTIDAQSFRFRR